MMALKLVWLTAALVLTSACRLPWSPTACDTVQIDWVNFLQVGSTQYLAGTVSTAEVQESDLGPIYARVKFKLSDNVCDPNYRPKDGDAGLLEPGTPIYQIKGQPPAGELAARFNGHILVYVGGQKGSPPAAGSIPVS